MAHAPNRRPLHVPTLTQMVADTDHDMAGDDEQAIRSALYNAWQDSEIDPMEAMDSMIDELLH